MTKRMTLCKNFVHYGGVMLSASLFASLISLSGCGAPDGPPAPPLPIMSGQTLLSVHDIVVLQNIQAQAILIQSIALLAESHSESSVIRAYGAAILKSYKEQQADAEKIAKNAHIILEKKSDQRDQAVLENIQKKYRKDFDKNFLKFFSQPLLGGFKSDLEEAQKNAKDDGLKALAKKTLSLYEQDRQNAQRIKHS